MKIRTQFILIFIILTCVPLVIMSMMFYNFGKKVIVESVMHELKSVADVQKARTNELIDRNIERIRLVASRTQLRISLQKHLIQADEIHLVKMRKILKDALQSIHDFKSIMIVSLEGDIIASTKGGLEGGKFLHTQFLKQCGIEPNLFMERGQDSVWELFLGAPLILDRELLGAVIVTANPDSLMEAVQGYEGLTSSGELILAKRTKDGDAEFIGVRKFADEEKSLNIVPKTRTEFSVTQALLKNEDSFINLIDYRFNPVFSSTRYIKKTDWGLVVKVDQEEVLQRLAVVKKLSLVLFFLSIFFIVVVAVWLAQTITQPIFRFTQQARDISRGELQNRVQVKTKSDEISVLAKAFNQMAENLQKTMVSRDDLLKEVEDRKKVEIELERSNKDLEEFAYVASHDLQEPLRMVASFTQLLERKYAGQLDDQAKKYIFFASDGAKRMQRLISDLLKYSRVGTETQPMREVDLNKGLETILTDLKLYIRENNAKVELQKLPVVWADEVQMAQLFQNLIKNAIKFQRKGVAPEVQISCEEKEHHWLFCIEDNGVGIEKKNLDKIFVIFQRLHTKEAFEGTGIGLAVCKRIVERHQGKIWVESEFNRGSKFYFTLHKKSV